MLRATLATASGSGPLPQLPPGDWKIPPFRHWAGGGAWPTSNIFASPDTSWLAIQQGCVDPILNTHYYYSHLVMCICVYSYDVLCHNLIIPCVCHWAISVHRPSLPPGWGVSVRGNGRASSGRIKGVFPTPLTCPNTAFADWGRGFRWPPMPNHSATSAAESGRSTE